MKAVSPLWLAPNTDATNSSGFTALPGGDRIIGGTYNFIGEYGFWWSSNQSSSTNARYRYLNYNIANIFQSNVGKTRGFSVRCVRD
jgi:uncharacterized protein (TIGR02145 family)